MLSSYFTAFFANISNDKLFSRHRLINEQIDDFTMKNCILFYRISIILFRFMPFCCCFMFHTLISFRESKRKYRDCVFADCATISMDEYSEMGFGTQFVLFMIFVVFYANSIYIAHCSSHIFLNLPSRNYE